MQNGTVYRLPPLVRLTDVTGCSSFPTPKASDSERGGRGELLALVRGKKARQIWPTPTASSHKTAGPHGSKSHQHDIAKGNLRGVVMEPDNTGQLNPTWVEWLMGFPLGWTDLEDSETP